VYNTRDMSRILFEPKRRLLARTTLAFALVLALQAGLSAYLILNVMERTLQSRLDNQLIRVGFIITGNQQLMDALTVSANNPEAFKILARMSHSLGETVNLTGIRRSYLARIEHKHFVYLGGTSTTGKALPNPNITTRTQWANLLEGKAITTPPFRAEDGSLVKAAYIPVMKGQRLLGIVAVEDDATDLEAMTLLKRKLYVVSIVGFLFVVFVSFTIARTIITPVRRLVDAAEELGAGKFNARFKVTGADEINFLGQTFNDMAEDIQARDKQIRQMNEAALADARQLYEHVLRAMESALLTVDLDGNLTSENPAVHRLLGGPHLMPRHIEERLAFYESLLEIWRRRDSLTNREVVLHTPAGERFIEVTLQPLSDHRNEQIGYSLLLTDRTEEKRLQSELDMRKRLAALGELAAGIAHEIRNPLNGIELMLGLVQEDLQQKGFADDRFTSIHDEVARLNVVVNDFLLFARPKPLEKEPFQLVELMEDALMFTLGHLEEKSIEVVRDFADDLPPALLDPAAMRRAFVNLIQNACQAMEPGGCLTLAIHLVISPINKYFLVRIIDNGPGIPLEVIDKIFHPFVTSKADGTGLGLSIVHKTIVNHNGSIRCYNREEGGACFDIEIPYVEGI